MAGLKKADRVFTLADLLSRGVEFGECVLWTGRTNGRGTGLLRYMGKEISAVRLSYMLNFKRTHEDMAGLMVWANCGETLCMNPKHLCCGTRTQWRKYMDSQGWSKPTPSTIAKHMKNGRASGRCKLSMEVVRQIRASDETTAEWARRLGVHKDTVAIARRGETWKESPVQASVFNWRPAA